MLCLAWLCANGALWDCVQVFAWGKMIHDYSQIMPLTKAVERTFDGSAPCEICLVVVEGKAPQTPPQVERSHEKVVLAYHATEEIFLQAPESCWPAPKIGTGPMRTDEVPVRPPLV